MRGEDQKKELISFFVGETPPHAWGRRNPSHELFYVHRNTPTCVGKTRNGEEPEIAAQKHPHMRGEDPERSLNFFLHTWY